MNNKIQNTLVLVLFVAGGVLLTPALTDLFKRVKVRPTSSAQANVLPPVPIEKVKSTQPEAEPEVAEEYDDGDGVLNEEQIRFLVMLETKAKEMAALAEHYRKDLELLAIADSNPDFSTCTSICSPVVIDNDLDQNLITNYFKKNGAKSFESHDFVNGLVAAKISEQTVTRRLMEIYVNDLDPKKLKEDPKLLKRIMREMQVEHSKTSNQSKDANWERTRARIDYNALHLECEDNKIHPDEALRICKQLADTMGVPQ